MQREQIAFVGTSDYSGHFRGKSFPAADLPGRLLSGVGLTPTNLFISAFGPIHHTPFGTKGEVVMIPDPSTRVMVPFEGSPTELFYLGDVRTLEGAPFEFCPRGILRRALERMERETGLRLFATFEQEMNYSGVPGTPMQPYELDAYRRQGVFGESLVAALRLAGVVPDSFLAEFGARQYEITTTPAIGVRAADEAAITREIAQAVAFRLGHRVSFAPLPTPDGVSNGTHIHFSFLDGDGRPVMYEESAPSHLSALGWQFIAGILHHLPALCAVTVPSVVSYYRLRPNRWAPTFADVADVDRGTALRICPLAAGEPARRARQFNLEFRVADATASPYLALAVMVQAGLDGIREKRVVDALERRPLPSSLPAALDLLEATPAAAEWLGSAVLPAYLAFKRGEAQSLDGLDEAEVCRRYAEVY